MYEVTEKRQNENLAVSDKKIFLNPRYVFMPIKEGFKLRVKDNQYVYKNDIVAINKSGKMIYSSVSGRVLGVKEMERADLDVPSLVIENDFKENIRARKSARKFLSGIKREEFFSLLEDAGLVYKGEYESEKLKRTYTSFIINGIELEPGFENKRHIVKDNVEDILETIDLIANVIGAESTILAISNDEAEIINSLVNAIGTYPNIQLKLLENEYPNGQMEILLKKLGLKNSLGLDVTEIFNIREVLKREMPVQEKYISIVGEGVKDGGVVKVKIGSLLSEVFVLNFGFAVPNVDVYLNGQIHGEKVKTLKYVIDEDLDGIYVEVKRDRKMEACINCGLCSKKCPKGLNPKYVFDHKGNVKSAYYDACIDCGLCSHLCPSNIDLRSYMRMGRYKDGKEK